MVSIRFCSALIVPVVSALVLLSGCNKEKPPDPTVANTKPEATTPKKDLEAIAGTPTASLTGRVVLDGEVPKREDLKAKMTADTAHCTKDVPMNDMLDPTWIVGENKGLPNAVVWISPPENKYFKIPEAKQKREEPAIIDQPFCMFQPFVQTYYPSYYDPAKKEQVPTGQKLCVKNSAPISHNTKTDRTAINDQSNELIGANKQAEFNFVPCSKKKVGTGEMLTLQCNIHGHMKGYLWVFDHPYHVKTDANGNFEIKELPAGAEVQLAYWHPSFGGAAPKREKFTIKDGENKKDITIKAP